VGGLSRKKRASKDLAQVTLSFSNLATNSSPSLILLRRSAPPPPPSSHPSTGPPRRGAEPPPEFLRPPRMLGAARRQLGSGGPVSAAHTPSLSCPIRGDLVGVGPRRRCWCISFTTLSVCRCWGRCCGGSALRRRRTLRGGTPPRRRR
jgi:hypothetical protein